MLRLASTGEASYTFPIFSKQALTLQENVQWFAMHCFSPRLSIPSAKIASLDETQYKAGDLLCQTLSPGSAGLVKPNLN